MSLLKFLENAQKVLGLMPIMTYKKIWKFSKVTLLKATKKVWYLQNFKTYKVFQNIFNFQMKHLVSKHIWLATRRRDSWVPKRMLACMPTCFNEGPVSLLLLKREFPQGDSYCASVNDIQYCFPLFLSYIAVEELSFCSLSLFLAALLSSAFWICRLYSHTNR